MKNLIIIAIIAVIAFISYNYYQPAEVENIVSIETTALLRSSSPDNAAVFILEPGDGAIVSSPVTIKFGISNMQIAPAGTDQENSGHHHILLDLEELPDMSLPIPANDNIIHFGKGQTETTIELTPGKHSLQLLLGNYLHIPHKQVVISKRISITVE